jgi:N-acetylglutamate synthase-like GNAT family acetyltransferase
VLVSTALDKQMKVEFEYLVDHPDQIYQVVKWWRTAWDKWMDEDDEVVAQQIRSSLGKENLPIDILAFIDGKVVGAAALKLQELVKVYPQYQYWLGSVFVDESYRGNQIATALTMRIIDMAKEHKLPHLYLQTANLSGGLYAKLGWKKVEQFRDVDEETLLMVKTL